MIKSDFHKLEQLILESEKMGKAKVKVGWWGEENATKAHDNEFPSNPNTPVRSTLRLPLSKGKKDIIKATAKNIKKQITNGSKMNIEKSLNILGITAVSKVLEGFETKGFGTWKGNAPSTIKEKGKDDPMIDTGDLRRSVSYKVDISK